MEECMLDTDVLSAFLRGNANVASHVKNYLEHFSYLNLSVITYYEILNGLMSKSAYKQIQRFEEFVGLNRVIPLSSKMAREAATVHSVLKNSGLPIGHTDTLIAGIAIVSDFRLITNNIKHFERVEGLRIANWM